MDAPWMKKAPQDPAWVARLHQASAPAAHRPAANLPDGIYPYQAAAVEFGMARGGRALIAHEMGLGKTVTALALMQQYRGDWPLLILAPRAVLAQWEEEVQRWVSPAPVVSVIKKGKDAFKPGTEIAIMTHDLFKMPANAHLRAAPRGGAWRALIVDESHKCKDAASKRTRAVRATALDARRVALLTGTPYVTGANDLQPRVKMALQPGARPHLPRFHDWERRYCEESEINTGYGSFSSWSKTKPERKAELNRVLAPLMDRKAKREVASQLPGKLVSRLFLDAAPAVRRRVDKRLALLRSMPKEDQAALDEAERTPTHEIMKLFRDNAVDRAEAVVEWIVENFLSKEARDANGRKKLVVFAHHRDVMDKLEAELRKRLAKKDADGATMIRADGDGAKGPNGLRATREEAIRGWQAGDKCQVALLSIMACGTGLNLTEASTMVFAEMHWSHNQHAQAEGRIHRVTQTAPCVIYYAMFARSLDNIMYAKLQSTKRDTEDVVDGPATNAAGEGAPRPEDEPPRVTQEPPRVTPAKAKRPRADEDPFGDMDEFIGPDPARDEIEGLETRAGGSAGDADEEAPALAPPVTPTKRRRN